MDALDQRVCKVSGYSMRFSGVSRNFGLIVTQRYSNKHSEIAARGIQARYTCVAQQTASKR